MEDRVRTDSAANRSDQYVPGVLAGRPSQNVARLGAAITTSICAGWPAFTRRCLEW